MQLNTHYMLLDDTLRRLDLRIIVPVQDFRHRERDLGLYYMNQQSVSTAAESSRGRICGSGLQYVIVATSEFLVNFGGLAILVRNHATTQEPLSIVKIKTLLNPPSRFSYPTTLVAPGHTRIALSQSAVNSN